MKKAIVKGTKKALIVTEKQLDVIREACELYGRIQLGQFEQFAEIVTQTGFCGFGIRVHPERNKDETDEEYEERKEYLYRRDEIIRDCIKGAIYGSLRQAYCYNGKPRTNEADVALDIWAVLDGRREDGFHMGSEPLAEVKDVEN